MKNNSIIGGGYDVVDKVFSLLPLFFMGIDHAYRQKIKIKKNKNKKIKSKMTLFHYCTMHEVKIYRVPTFPLGKIYTKVSAKIICTYLRYLQNSF